MKESESEMCAVSVKHGESAEVYRPEHISGFLLAFMNQALSPMYNLENVPPKVVTSIPAYFNTVQCRVLIMKQE